MRVALPSVAVIAAFAYACSTFVDAEDAPPTPAVDAGADGTAPAACTPVIVDFGAPQDCTADVMTDPQNCGTCGHACVDTQCLEGRCVAERITGVERNVFAIDGTTLYVASGGDIERADLTKRPIAFELFAGVFGEARYLEAYDGDLYVSTTQQPTIVRLADKAQRGNEQYERVSTLPGDGFFFPGRVAYYVGGPMGATVLARIDTASGDVKKKTESGFFPVARSGEELFWTKTVASGAEIWGAWDADDEPIVRVGTSVEGFAAEGNTVFFAAGGFVVRAERNRITNLANEPGKTLGAVVSGDQLFYLVRRESPVEIRYGLYRIDKCRGGRPVLLYETVNARTSRFVIENDTYLLVSTEFGIFRVRR